MVMARLGRQLVALFGFLLFSGICLSQPVSPPTSICDSFASCLTCAVHPSCGWCAYLLQCLPGTVNGSYDGVCASWSTFWMFGTENCPEKSPLPSVCTSKPCAECSKSTSCGWCDGNCLPGTLTSPYYGVCNNWSYGKCPIVSAKTVWWIWFLFALMIVALIASAAGIFLFKRCRAFINGTPVSGEEFQPTYKTEIYMEADTDIDTDLGSANNSLGGPEFAESQRIYDRSAPYS